MFKRILRRASASSTLSSVCRFHVETTSSRISAHVAHVTSSNPCPVHVRYYPTFSVFARSAPCSTKITSSRTQFYRTRNETISRSLSSANDSRTFSPNASAEQSRADLWYPADWSKRELLMTACSGFYDHLPQGANVIASYIDTAASVEKTKRKQMPTVLVVSSGMTDDIELKPLLELMVKDGWRVIIPDLLGMGHTRGLSDVDSGCFTYRFSERTAFVADFISAANVHRVDVAVGHGLGCFLLPVLAGNFKLFGSVAMIAPLPCHKPLELTEPMHLTVRLMSWLQHKLKRYATYLWLSRVWQERVGRWFGIKEKFYLVFLERLFTFFMSVNYDAVVSSAQLFQDYHIPLLYAYSSTDEFVSSEIHTEFAQNFGASSDLTETYSSDHKLIEKCSEIGVVRSQHYVKTVVFDSSCSSISSMDPPVANILLQEIKQIYKHRISAPR